ncbi:MAG TPA: transporter substrate-binding domain-containing protein [Candidatus Binatia bacterium]|nr:transporter substrate-binding domain-containing protein [Candidatus Binatia bacterium]
MKRILLALLLCAVPAAATAQPKEEKLRIATRLVRPFVFEQNGRLTGFSIELWQEIAQQMKVRSEFIVKPTVRDLLASVNGHEAHLGIAAISITAERELKWDFSQPMFEAGLQILTPVQGSGGSALVKAIAANLFSAAVLPYVLGVALILVAIAHAVWLVERRNPTGMLAHRSYYPGIFEACWWAAATLATQADQMPRAALARVVAVLWMFTSVVFIAYFTAAVTSNLTVQQLQGEINGPGDLPGKRVATVKGSTSAEYLRQHNIEPSEFAKVEEAFQALLAGEADAVVYDAPVLLYFASHEGKGKAQTVGSIFRKENYGIVFPDKSPLRKRVNEALLKLKESGKYDELYAKWFGGSAS